MLRSLDPNEKNTGTACTAKLSVVEKSKKSQPTHSPKKTRSESRGAATTWLPAELTFTSFLLQEPQLHTHPWVPGDSYHTGESTGSSLSALWGWSAHIHQSKQQQQQQTENHFIPCLKAIRPLLLFATDATGCV